MAPSRQEDRLLRPPRPQVVPQSPGGRGLDVCDARLHLHVVRYLYERITDILI